MAKMSWFSWLLFALVTIGALNWGLIGFLNFNLVERLFGIGTLLTKVIYDAVGIAALIGAIQLLAKAIK